MAKKKPMYEKGTAMKASRLDNGFMLTRLSELKEAGKPVCRGS
jgi:hypothetical protein